MINYRKLIYEGHISIIRNLAKNPCSITGKISKHGAFIGPNVISELISEARDGEHNIPLMKVVRWQIGGLTITPEDWLKFNNDTNKTVFWISSEGLTQFNTETSTFANWLKTASKNPDYQNSNIAYLINKIMEARGESDHEYPRQTHSSSLWILSEKYPNPKDLEKEINIILKANKFLKDPFSIEEAAETLA